MLFSFHGLPERQIVKTDDTGKHACTFGDCCETLANPSCYRAQCFATARALVGRLGLARDGYTICFQSRLGRTPWIQPFTDHRDRRAREGRARSGSPCCARRSSRTASRRSRRSGCARVAQFKAAGGEELVLVPSLNATPAWVDAVVGIAHRHGHQTST